MRNGSFTSFLFNIFKYWKPESTTYTTYLLTSYEKAGLVEEKNNKNKKKSNKQTFAITSQLLTKFQIL